MPLWRRKQKEVLFIDEPRKSLFEGLTWTCHICHEERPDNKISVLVKPVEAFGDLRVTENVRYCNDKPECYEAAKTFTHIHLIGGDDEA